MAEAAPLLAFFGVRRNDIVPQPVRVIVRSQPSVDNVNMFMLAQLLFDVGPLEENLLPLAPPLLVLGELDAMHHQFGMGFLNRFYFHPRLQIAIVGSLPGTLIRRRPG